MNLTRMIPSAVCLGLVCLLLAGTALAGEGDLTEAETRFTTTDCNSNFTNADQVYTMGVARSAEQDFIARYTLNLGEFGATPAVPIVGGPGTATGRSGGLSSREVEYDVDVTGAFTAGTTTLTLAAPVVRFPGGSEAGTTMTITIDLRDASGPIDLCGVKTQNLAVLANGCAVGGVNNAPTAVDDSVSTNPDVALIIDVLSNDSDLDGDSLTVGSVTQPPNGSVMINPGAARVTYTPASKFTGTDSFSYTVTDGNGGTDTATVTVRVHPPTVLVANFMNGNSTAWNSRVYLWNPSASEGNVTVRVFTLPLKDGTAQELTTAPLDLGTLEARSALNINLAEDILTPLGIALPYTDNDGNLTLEFAIGEENVQGVAQVFSSSIAFGTYPLQEIPSTLNASPTVLVANFMNGNNSFLNSRAYLWNPSDSGGKITARAYTLPRSGASTLLGVVDLGLLEAKSARNIKIAENILSALDLPLPYLADGGNLTVEFTVETKSVQGLAQVFSANLAFGTYPMSHSVAMME